MNSMLSFTARLLPAYVVDPTWMMLGESCGIAAAIVARADIATQEILYPTLRTRLEKRGVVLPFDTTSEN
jgi:hypothetical protein